MLYGVWFEAKPVLKRNGPLFLGESISLCVKSTASAASKLINGAIQNIKIKDLTPISRYQWNNRLLSNLTSTTEKIEEIVKKVYRQIDKVHADTVIDDARSAAEKFFRDLRAYYEVQLFTRTSIDKLLSIPTNQWWYRFLANTDDFEIQTHIQETDLDRWGDILTHKDTNTCITIGGGLSQKAINAVEEYEKEFQAFARLPSDRS